jgi:UDP-glucose:glycoprotein glucosyltransferase
VWDLKDLGLQATQRIASGADPLRLLMDISQNFPSLASSLSRMQVNGSVREEVTDNQRVVPAGMSRLYLNGAAVDIDNIDPFAFVDR